MMKVIHTLIKPCGFVLTMIVVVHTCLADYSWQISGSYHSDSCSVF